MSCFPTYQVHQGHVLEQLRALPSESVHCVVTSPPYWGLRDYGVPSSVWGGAVACEHAWEAVRYRLEDHGDRGETGGPEGGRRSQEATRLGAIESATCGRCGAWLGCLGLEPTPELFVEHLVEVFRAVRRVLRADGTLWLNLGDTYATGAGRVGNAPGGGEQGARWRSGHEGKHGRVGPMTQPNRIPIAGLKPKDLVGIPWRVAFALQADGWWLRSDVVWSKPNAMPESVTDRPTKAHEYLFLLTRSESYFYDADAIREPHVDRREHKAGASAFRGQAQLKPRGTEDSADRYYHPAGRNRRTVWTVPTKPFPEAHFATFPPELVEPCVLAGTSERGSCATCGAPLQRQVERWRTLDGERVESVPPMRNTSKAAPTGAQGVSHMRTGSASRTTGWAPSCACGAQAAPCVVMDPFSGSGTTGVVAVGAGRSYVGVELNPQYRLMSMRRIAGVAPLLSLAMGAP